MAILALMTLTLTGCDEVKDPNSNIIGTWKAQFDTELLTQYMYFREDGICIIIAFMGTPSANPQDDMLITKWSITDKELRLEPITYKLEKLNADELVYRTKGINMTFRFKKVPDGEIAGFLPRG